MNVVPITPPDPEPLPSFDDLWTLVVKKCRKYETRLEWNKLDEAERLAAVIGAASWRRVWLRMEQQYIVDPCRWLKYRRWEDELPAAATSTHASHQPAVATPLPARTAMPDGVRQMLAKLRGKA